MTPAPNSRIWRHLPLAQQHGPDDPLEQGFCISDDRHVMIAQRPPSSNVLDRVSLRGWNEPEGVAVFWVRRWPTGNRQLEAFRDRQPLSWATVKRLGPG